VLDHLVEQKLTLSAQQCRVGFGGRREVGERIVPAEDGMVEVPAALNPDKLSIFRVVSATGVQVYACTRNPAGATGWVLRGPDAQLFDPENKPVGTHYAGPTWEDLDGGKVVGTVKASMPAPVDKAIPWLLLDAKSREGSGAFTQARAIVRMGTTGGAAPGDGCDEAVPVRNCAFPTRRSTCS